MRLPVMMLLGALSILPAWSADSKAGPVYTADGRLEFPENYREWIYLSSGVGMTYGPIAQQSQWGPPMFDNIFVNPEAYRAFLATGRWPDKTILVMEARQSESHASINNGGHFQTDIVGVEAEVKDSSTKEGPWNFYGFEMVPGRPVESARAVSHQASCYSCHGVKTAVENTFVQFYPPLYDAAEHHGTFNPGFEKLAITPGKLFDLVHISGWEKGKTALEDAVKRSPDATVMNMETENQLAYRLMGAGHVGDAIGLLEWVAARNPGSANIQDSLAEAYDRFGLASMARTATDRALKLIPDDKNLASARRDRLMKAADERLMRLPAEPSGAQSPRMVIHGGGPSVSPEGERIAFSSDRSGTPNIFVIRADGSGEVQVTNATGRRSGARWDASGRIRYSAWDGGKTTIFSIEPDGSKERQELILPVRNFLLSPDGKWIAFSRNRLFVSALDGTQERPLTDGIALEFSPAWSPDSKQIAFTRSSSDHRLSIWLMNSDGSGQRQLTHIPEADGQAEWPVWSLDGRRLAIQVGIYTPQKNMAHIWIVDVATGDAHKLAAHTEEFMDETPSWFPDGKRLAFQSNRTGRMEIWVMNVDGSGVRQVTR